MRREASPSPNGAMSCLYRAEEVPRQIPMVPVPVTTAPVDTTRQTLASVRPVSLPGEVNTRAEASVVVLSAAKVATRAGAAPAAAGEV